MLGHHPWVKHLWRIGTATPIDLNMLRYRIGTEVPLYSIQLDKKQIEQALKAVEKVKSETGVKPGIIQSTGKVTYIYLYLQPKYSNNEK